MSFFNNHKVLLIRALSVAVSMFVVAWLLWMVLPWRYSTIFVMLSGLVAITGLVVRFVPNIRLTTRPSEQPALPRTPLWPYITAAVISALLLAGVLTMVNTIVPPSYQGMVLIGGVVFAVVFPFFYGNQVRREIQRRWVDDAHADIVPDPNSSLVLLDQYTIDNVLNKLNTSDHRIIIAMRKVPVSPLLETLAPSRVKEVPVKGSSDKTRKVIYRNWGRAFGLLCIAVVVILVAVFAPVRELPTSQQTSSGELLPVLASLLKVLWQYFAYFAGWLAVLIVTVGPILLLARYCKMRIVWHSWYLIGTENRLKVIIQWPALLWFIDGRTPDLPYEKIHWCEAIDQDNWVSKTVRRSWGCVDVDGLTPHDGDLNTMTDLGYHTALSEIINTCMTLTRNRNSNTTSI